MARYAEWNSFICNLATDKYGQTDVNEVGIAFEKATVDVVPKSEVERLEKLFNDMTQEAKGYLNRLYGIRTEVAREIFEDIEKILDRNYYDHPFEYYASYMSVSIRELKKKYEVDQDGR